MSRLWTFFDPFNIKPSEFMLQLENKPAEIIDD